MAKALNRQEAELIARDHQYLKGKLIDASHPGRVINTIAAAPFSDENRNSYIRHFLFMGDAEEALDGYEGEEYNVLVISFIGDDANKLIWKTLADYLSV